jgi:hypothetical protein
VHIGDGLQNYGAVARKHFELIFGNDIFEVRQRMLDLLRMIVDGLWVGFRRIISALSIFSFRGVRSGSAQK